MEQQTEDETDTATRAWGPGYPEPYTQTPCLRVMV